VQLNSLYAESNLAWIVCFRCLHHICIYTVSHKKTRHFYFCDNSGKYWPISIILSPSRSQMNCRKRLNRICHLTSNLLPHYHAKVECLTQLLYSMLFNASVRRIFTVRRYALHGLSHLNSVGPSVRPSVCHTRALCPHGSTCDHDFFTMW